MGDREGGREGWMEEGGEGKRECYVEGLARYVCP